MSDETKLNFLDGHASSSGVLGILGFPLSYEGKDIEHTRFLTLRKSKAQSNGLSHEGWTLSLFESDLVSIAFEDSERGKAWWLLGKRGNVHRRGPTGDLDMQIQDAGTGPGLYGYLDAIRMINGKLYACGFKRQIYKYSNNNWVHCDEAILLKNREISWLSDITGTAEDVLCAVGHRGSIALGVNDVFEMLDSPTNANLNAVCVDDEGMFCAAGAYMTVVRGDGNGFITLCTDKDTSEQLWDIEWFQGQLVVATISGLFVVRGDKLVPFDSPPAPRHAGYKLSKMGDILWSIGEDKILCLEEGKWTEWVCPENV